jgi:peptide/nickel transport system ATP-binding protein
MVRVRGLSKSYIRGGLWGRDRITAVDHVDFEIPLATTMALVGESGSGKSTVARCVAGLEQPDAGEIWIGGDDIGDQNSATQSAAEGVNLPSVSSGRRVQLVFQDPVTAMNPRFSAAQILEEPLLIKGKDAASRKRATRGVVNEVGMPAEWLDRSVMEFSGGQRQRLAIARALLARPKILVLDEALSSLDLSTQAQIVNLLLDLQSAHSLTYILISHDPVSASRIADTMAVMAQGRIVEIGPTAAVMTAPKHEETLRLLTSARDMQASFAAVSGAIV